MFGASKTRGEPGSSVGTKSFESNWRAAGISKETRNSRNMKPIPLTIDRRRDSFERAMSRYSPSPITDYNYQSVGFGEFSGRYLRNPAPSLWNIAGDYFKCEARHDFWGEATLFAFITITAALPLMNNLHALIEFARAISSH